MPTFRTLVCEGLGCVLVGKRVGFFCMCLDIGALSGSRGVGMARV